MIGRYTHAHQFKRARRALKFLRIRLGRVIRDIRRRIAGNEALEGRFADLLALAVRVRFQDHRQRGPKVYALHAPEVECIGKGKARAPYEFGCKRCYGASGETKRHHRRWRNRRGAPCHSRMT
jgi:IS5 family transposase